MSHTAPASTPSLPPHLRVLFMGGGNMARAMLGGLLRQGLAAEQVTVIEPVVGTAAALVADFGVHAQPEASAETQGFEWVIWAVKPQVFAQAAAQTAAGLQGAHHLSVAAGIPSDAIARWLGTEQVVRAMPNTPALIGQGITGLYARPGVSDAARRQVEALMAPTGQWLWVNDEGLIDAVTALSGSGPAYVFYFLEAMVQAGTECGLSPAQARQLAEATFTGAAALASQSNEPLATLRERVTSKGGTTQAALDSLQAAQVQAHFVQSMMAAHRRAAELGREFGQG